MRSFFTRKLGIVNGANPTSRTRRYPRFEEVRDEYVYVYGIGRFLYLFSRL